MLLLKGTGGGHKLFLQTPMPILTILLCAKRVGGGVGGSMAEARVRFAGGLKPSRNKERCIGTVNIGT